jgi:TonB-linked SusC/RagA family outer membrane protein
VYCSIGITSALIYIKQQLAMKKSLLPLIFLFCMQLSVFAVSQTLLDKKVTLQLQNTELKRVFEMIEKQTSVRFVYVAEKIKASRKVTVSFIDKPLNDVLARISKDFDLNCEVNGEIVLVKERDLSTADKIVAFDASQNKLENAKVDRTINGLITDEKGVPLSGVSVQVKGTKTGTTTNNDGRFSLSIKDDNTVLVLVYTGYQTAEISVGAQQSIQYFLTPSSSRLDDVVVVGYGTQKKVTVTGSIGSVSTTEILRSPVASVANALAGRSPGIITVQRGGEPGRDIADIFIRGVATFAGGNSARPLVLVDGVERSLAGIDPYTIESFNILKDASATAVFGVRGANGVIIITTKTGQVGKPQFTFSSNLAWQNPIRLPKELDAVDYALLRNEAEANDQNNPTARRFSDYDIERYRKGDDPYFHPNIRWMDYMLKDYAPQQQYNLNVSGGTADTKYFVSLGYLNQDGIYKLGNLFRDFSANPNFKRYNIRSNFDFNISKDVSFFIKSSAEIQNSNYSNSATSDIFSTILSANPIMSPVLYDGKLVRNVDGLTAWQISNAPLYQMLFNGFNTNFSSRLNMNIGGKVKLDRITKGLSVRTMVAYDSYYLQNVSRRKAIPLWDLRRNPGATTFQDSIIPIPVVNAFEGPVSFLGESFSKNRKLYAEAAIDYTRSFGVHNVTALMLGTVERFYDGGNQLPFNYMGLVTRLTYNYKNKYFTDVNIGYNGSENFAVGKQFGFFPSLSAGYVVSQESFFPKSDFFSYLKLRGSYGMVGNDKIGGNRFLFLPSSFTSGASYFLGLANTPMTGYREASIGNPGVTWEVAKKLNIGGDFRFFKDKLTVAADVFSEKREKILWNLNVPITFGPTNLISPYNIGVAENKGFEIEMGFRDVIKSSKLTYYANANFTYTRNRIVYMDEAPQPFAGLAMTGNRIGQPKGLIAEGIYNTWEEINNPKRPKSVWEGAGLVPGDIRYKDVNGDGIIDDNDRSNIGNPNIPGIIYGATVGAQWKGFEISLFFQGAAQVSTYLTGESAWPFIAGTKTAFERAKESWSAERFANGQKITLPRLTAAPDANRHNYRVSSFWMQDASYLRLKNVEVAYTFAPKIIQKLSLKSLRVYMNGQNLVTWTKMEYFDPEIPSSNGAVYPMMRVFNFGVNVQF